MFFGPSSLLARLSAILKTRDSARSSRSAGSPLRVEAGFGDLVGHRNHFAHHRAFAHDVGIGADVSRAGRVFGQFGQIGEAAHAVQLPLTLQRLGERNQVNRTAGLLQARHLGKNMTVRTGIKSSATTRSATSSQRSLSSIKPPNTDCSASIECGGTFSPASCGSRSRVSVCGLLKGLFPAIA